MSTQQYDSNGNPIFSTGALGTPDQQVSDSTGNIINPAKEDGNLLSIKTNTDKFTFASTRLVIDGSGVIQPVSQSGTWNINNISGTVSLPTGASTETTLSAINTKLVTGTVIGDVNAAQKGTWSVRLQDGAGTALTSTLVNTRQALDIHQADTSFIVSGLTAVGSTPSLNPVSISGVDGGGLKRALLTDTGGSLLIQGRYPDNTVANPNPVVVGGLDDTGTVQTITADDLVGGREFLYALTLPEEADSCNDNTFYATTVEFTLPTGGTETPFLLIKNPTGSGKKMWVDDMQMDVITKGQQATCRLYHTPTTTANGTAVTITNVHIGGGAPASAMQSFTGPTVTANGTKVRVFSVGTNSNSAVISLSYGLILEPNNAILVTGNPTANNVVVAFSVRWTEDL